MKTKKVIRSRYLPEYLYPPTIAAWFSLLLLACTLVNASDSVSQSINIEVTTHLGDKQRFKAGDKIAFLVSLDKDAHLLMIYEDAEHNLIQVLPNQYREKSLYKEGLFIAVPDKSEPFEFIINPPFGNEKLWVFASSKQFPELEGTRLKNGLKKLDKELPEILASIRPKTSRTQYGESSTVITTEAQ